jgi:hypothetical protein
MKIAWFVFRGIDFHTVAYMDALGAEVGSTERQFFGTRREAELAARRAGWRGYEVTWSLAPTA